MLTCADQDVATVGNETWEATAYEYNTQYNLQPTEDHEEARNIAEQKGYIYTAGKRPNYKPTALRWYFISAQILMTCIVMAIVAYARVKMPNSDSTATIEGRSLAPNSQVVALVDFGVVTSTSAVSIPAGDIVTIMDSPYIKSLSEDTASLSSQAGEQENGVEIDVTIPRTPCGTSTVCVATITKQVISTLIIPATTQFLTFTMSVTTIYNVIEEVETIAPSDIFFTTDIVTEVVDVTVIYQTVTLTVPRPPQSFFNSSRPTTDPTDSDQQLQPTLTTQTRTLSQTITQTITTPSVGTIHATGGVVTKTRTETIEVPVLGMGTVTNEDQTYFQLGDTTIEVTYTPEAGRNNGGGAAPITHIIETIEPGGTVTKVIEDGPIQVVINQENEVKTVIAAPLVNEVVQQVGGDVTNVVVVITPSPIPRTGRQGSDDTMNVQNVADPQQGGSGSGSNSGQAQPDQPGGSNSNQGGSSGQGSSGQGSAGQGRPGSSGSSSGQGSGGQGRPGQAGASGSNQQGSGTFDDDDTFEPITLTVVSADDYNHAPSQSRHLNGRGSLTTFELVTTPVNGENNGAHHLPHHHFRNAANHYLDAASPHSRLNISRHDQDDDFGQHSDPDGRGDTDRAKVYSMNASQYFVGKFLPALLAILLSIPLRVIDLNAKLYQPFYALNRDGGAMGPDSMTLHFNGFKGFTKPFIMLSQGHPMTFLTSMILWGSSLMVPLATEAIGLKLHEKCSINNIKGCGVALGISPGPTHALLALMGLIVVFLLILVIITRNSESGLFANPWSILGIASLARSRDVRIWSARKESIRKETNEKRYGFGYFQNEEGRDEYGIVLKDDSAQNLRPDGDNPAMGGHGHMDDDDDFVHDVNSGPMRTRSSSLSAESQRTSVPFLALSFTWRIIFTLFLVGLFVVILFYHIQVMKGWNPEFRSFMNSGKFGARFLFAGFGVIITFAWVAFFVSVAIITPYQQLSRSAQPPERSILLSRPTHGIYGLFSGIKEGNIFLVLTSFIAILVEFLPLLLANVPFSLTQTLLTHKVCARLSLSILTVMIMTLIASMFVKWPKMPVDPRSVAGAIYYVSGSDILMSRAEGTGRMDRETRDKTIRQYGGRYYYGAIPGKGRTGVEADEGAGVGEDVETGYHGNRI
ncbi:unnamed protein product [Parascedosporium putredinis]|uniref:Zonadhesin n=1 Tax=Parascedosporium putredinis TaxID=1442378 RepID=A0A9P1H636_9PEZI|nr:unnamed protein product [Parascedosporium putredinis]CAI7999915.1 unnamed protein product [Parascedosporium putredinis]